MNENVIYKIHISFYSFKKMNYIVDYGCTIY